MAKKPLEITYDTMPDAEAEEAAAEGLIKTKPKPETHSKKFILTMKPSVHADMMAICKRRGISANGLINEWIEAFVEENRAEAEEYRQFIGSK